jgi:hypothetical protein
VIVLFEIVLRLVLENINPHKTVNPESVVYDTFVPVVFSMTIPAGLVAQRISSLCVGSNQVILILVLPLAEMYFPPVKFKTVFPVALPFATTLTQSASILIFPAIEAGTSSIT